MEGTEELKIYRAIQALKDYFSENTTNSFSGARRVSKLDADELDALVNDIEMAIPEEIRRANGIYIERDRILGDAREQADSIVKTANTRAESLWNSAQESTNELIAHAKNEQARLVSQHEITKAAERAAKAIKEEATNRCNEFYARIQEEAHQLLDEVSKTMELSAKQLEESRELAFNQLKQTISDVNNSTRSIITSINTVNADIEAQREWIDGREPRTRQQHEIEAPEYPEYSEEETVVAEADDQSDELNEKSEKRQTKQQSRQPRSKAKPDDDAVEAKQKQSSGFFGKVIDFFVDSDDEEFDNDSVDFD